MISGLRTKITFMGQKGRNFLILKQFATARSNHILKMSRADTTQWQLGCFFSFFFWKKKQRNLNCLGIDKKDHKGTNSTWTSTETWPSKQPNWKWPQSWKLSSDYCNLGYGGVSPKIGKKGMCHQSWNDPPIWFAPEGGFIETQRREIEMAMSPDHTNTIVGVLPRFPIIPFAKG